MFAEQPPFQKPPDTNAPIWRYLDFSKFVDLLETQTLFFNRTDRFDDEFEGSYPQLNTLLRPMLYGGETKISAHLLAKMSVTFKEWRRFMAINCWHMSNHESAAMWKLYLKGNEGISICSTYNRLVESFLPCDDTIYVGVVKYIDYDTEWMPEGSLFYPFVHKRKSFQHENELRAIICRFPIEKDGKADLSQDTIDQGINVPIAFTKLVSKVCVAPTSPGWFRRLVEVVLKKYNLEAEVVNSSLAKRPVY